MPAARTGRALTAIRLRRASHAPRSLPGRCRHVAVMAHGTLPGRLRGPGARVFTTAAQAASRLAPRAGLSRAPPAPAAWLGCQRVRHARHASSPPSAGRACGACSRYGIRVARARPVRVPRRAWAGPRRARARTPGPGRSRRTGAENRRPRPTRRPGSVSARRAEAAWGPAGGACRQLP